jgi:diguanylate cyclase (GGDEF)-like protein/PAS domain S-box-containing protein
MYAAITSLEIGTAVQDYGCVAALRHTGLLDSPPEAPFDRLTALAARVLRVPVARMSLVDADRQFFKSGVGENTPWARALDAPGARALAEYVVGSATPLVVPDASTHPLARDEQARAPLSGIAYLGVPLATRSGHVLGSFCVLDAAPRAWTPDDVEALESLAAAAMTEIEFRDAARTAAVLAEVAEEAMHAREVVLERLPDGVFTYDQDWRITFMNRAAAEMVGWSRDAVIGRALWDVAPYLVGTEVEAAFRRAVGERRLLTFETASPRTGRWFEVQVDPTDDGARVYCRDISARHAAQAALRESESRFRGLVEQSPEAIVLHGGERIHYVNPAGLKLLGHDGNADSLAQLSIFDLLAPECHARARERTAALFAGQRFRDTIEYRVHLQTGDTIQVEVTSVVVRHDGVPAIQSHLRDVTERRLLEAQLAHQAFHDTLTGLPNRALFQDRVAHALTRSRRECPPVVLLLDLDHFKSVNDSFGHAAGDTVLREAGERIARCLRASDTLARLGGDEFAILLDDGCETSAARDVADRIVDALMTPFAVQGTDVLVGASLGLAAAEPGHTVEEVLRNADLAMYRAKGAGRAGVMVFAPAMHTEARRRVEMQADLRRTLDGDASAGTLHLHYQPIVHLATGALYGLEALVRWAHPERGLVSPLEFIPLAEQTGLVVPLEQWVLQHACRQMRHWQLTHPDAGLESLTVNLSGRHLASPDMVADVTYALAHSGLAPRCLVLELTESMLVHDTRATLERLRALKALGVRLAIDDFGTGYSSLAYLERFPVDILKIDKSFIDGIAPHGIAGGSAESPLAQAVLGLGRALGMRVVAEGIERDEQHTRLSELGCEFGQGFHFARPLPPDAVERLLEAGDAPADAVQQRELAAA